MPNRKPYPTDVSDEEWPSSPPISRWSVRTPARLPADRLRAGGLGLSGGSFTIVIAALMRLVSEQRRSWAMGLATAAGTFGQFAFAPLGHAFLASYGWQTALLLLTGFVTVVPALAVALKGWGEGIGADRDANEPALPMREALRAAFWHGSYLLLVPRLGPQALPDLDSEGLEGHDRATRARGWILTPL